MKSSRSQIGLIDAGLSLKKAVPAASKCLHYFITKVGSRIIRERVSLSIKLLTIFLSSIFVFSLTAHAQKAELVVQTGHATGVGAVAVSADGKLIASGSWDRTVRLWDSASGLELRVLTGHSSPVTSIVFSPDGKSLASGSLGDIFIWDVASGKRLHNFVNHTNHAGDSVLTRLRDNFGVIAFSPDGGTLANGNGERFDVKSGKVIQTPVEKLLCRDFICSVTLSSNGQLLIRKETVQSSIEVWDVRRGQLLRQLGEAGTWVHRYAFSPGGNVLAAVGSGDSKTLLTLWNVADGQKLRTFETPGHYGVSAVQLSGDGKILAAGLREVLKDEGRGIILWDTASGNEIRTLNEQSDTFNAIALSSDRRRLVGGRDDGDIKIWDIESGALIRTLKRHSPVVTSVVFGSNGSLLARSSDDETIKIWDVKGQRALRTFEAHPDNDDVHVIAFSPDGKILASGNKGGEDDDVRDRSIYEDDSIKLWNVTNGKLLCALKGHTDFVTSVAFGQGGQVVATGSRDETVRLWDTASGRELQTLRGHTDTILRLLFSNDGTVLASGSEDETVKLWSVADGKELLTLKGHDGNAIPLAFSADGKSFASLGADKIINLWEVATGAPQASFSDWEKLPLELKLSLLELFDAIGQASETGEVITVEADGNRIRFKDFTGDGEVIATLSFLDDSDWAIVTPSGLFDASAGVRKLMHYVVGFEPVSLEQMKEVYYVPNLLQKVFRNEPLPKVELFSKRDLFPSVKYEGLNARQKRLTVKLTNRGGGIGQVQVLFNGKEVTADARPAGFNPNVPHATLTINLSGAAIKTGAENKVEIVARNAAGSLSTRGTSEAELTYDEASGDPVEPPNIYAIVVGISDYTGDKLRLNFAAKDAEDFAHALEVGAVKLLNGDQTKVHIRLLTSDGENSTVRFDAPDAKTSTATKADFTRAFADFRAATSNDVFIVYLAGHGISLNLNKNQSQVGGDTYLYLTQEATTADKTALTVEDARRAMAISSEELKELMKQNKALKQVLILDTCAAGALSNSLAEKRDIPSDQIRALERLKDSTGFFVLMGASSDSVSYEASQYGQGLLTYSLLQGMKGARLREGQFADVAMLFGYAQDTVPQMAKNIGGIQRPLVIMPDTSSSFDIGQFTPAEQQRIPLSVPKPLVLRPNLRNTKMRFDNLKLSQMMTEQLRQASYVQARGEQSRIVFVEADEMTDAVLPVGDYMIEGDELKLSVILVKNNAPVGKEITLAGKADEAKKVIKQLVEVIVQSLP